MGWREDVAEAKGLMAQVRDLNLEGKDGASGIDSGEKAEKTRKMIAAANELAEKAKAAKASEDDQARLTALLDGFDTDAKGVHTSGDPSILEGRKTTGDTSGEVVRQSSNPHVTISKSMARKLYGEKTAAQLRPADTKVLAEGTDAAGGYLVVPEYHQELFAAVRRTGNAMRALGWVSLHPTNSKKLYIPKGAGSAVVGWTPEDTPAPSQDQSFTQIGVDIFKLTGISKLSEELFEDGDPSAMDIAITELGKLAAIAEEQAWLYGTGTNQPKGILTSFTNSVITNTADFATATTQQAQIDLVIAMASTVMTSYFAPVTGVLISPRRYAFWRKAKDSQNNYLFNAPGTFRAPGDFGTSLYNGGDVLGLPLGLSGNIPLNLGGGTNEDRIIAADWSEAHAFIRRDVTIDTNTTGDTAFTQGQVLVKLTQRQGFTAERQVNAFCVGTGAGLATF